MAPLPCENIKLGHLVLIDICTEHFFVALFPYTRDSTPLCLPSPSVFKMGTQLTSDILLGVSLWWTRTPSRGGGGGYNTPRHRMLHAKETGISSSCLDLWPMCTISLLLNILNVILNLSKYESQSHQLAVWSLRSEVCRLSSADCEVCSLSSAFCGGLQVEFCSLRPTVWGLQSEVCMSSSAASEHWGLQSELCSLHSADWHLQCKVCRWSSAVECI